MELKSATTAGVRRVFEELSPPYKVVVVDPPWQIDKVRRRTRPNQGAMDYSMMTLDEIATMPVGSLADEVSTCFLWTIDRYLYDSPAILKAWGFKYHLTMSWDKGNGMSMFGFNRRTEFVLVGFKGAHDAYPDGPVIRSAFTAASHGHSVKPGILGDMIEASLPGPYVELFARQPRLGWDAWGYGVESVAS